MRHGMRDTGFGIALAVLLAVQVASAVEFIQTNEFVVSENASILNETWLSAQRITINGTATNDLFATAPMIELNGTFSGDVWSAGNDITAEGIFLNDVRLISKTTQVFGTLHGSLIAGGTTVKIGRTAVLYQDVLCFGENVIIEGSVAGDARVIAQRAIIGGKIDGDLTITAQEIVILPGTILNGDLIYTAPNELVLSPTVILSGTLNRTFEAAPVRKLLKKNLPVHFMFGLAALITGLVFAGLFPRYMGTTLYTLNTSRGLCSLAGFAGLVIIPMGAFALLFTLIGLPLSILIFLFYFILLYLSKIAGALWIGSALLRRKEFNKRKAAAPLALGLLIIYALTSFKATGMLINFVILIFGFGALLISLFKKPVLVIQTPDAVNEINKEG